MSQVRPSKLMRDTRCLNPNPVYVRPQDWKSLTGEHGRAFKLCQMRDVSCDPIFVRERCVVGRTRAFRKESRRLLNALSQYFASNVDLATNIVSKTIKDISHAISKTEIIDEFGNKQLVDAIVTESRVCRILNKVFSKFGLIEETPLNWDESTRMWYPKTIVLTDRFYRIIGANIDKLNAQRDNKLARMNKSYLEAQHERRRKVIQNSIAKRLSLRASSALMSKSYDERKRHVSAIVVKSLSEHERKTFTDEKLEHVVRSQLQSLGMGADKLTKSTKILL